MALLCVQEQKGFQEQLHHSWKAAEVVGPELYWQNIMLCMFLDVCNLASNAMFPIKIKNSIVAEDEHYLQKFSVFREKWFGFSWTIDMLCFIQQSFERLT